MRKLLLALAGGVAPTWSLRGAELLPLGVSEISRHNNARSVAHLFLLIFPCFARVPLNRVPNNPFSSLEPSDGTR